MSESKKINYFLRLFRGDISLTITFWLWFIFVSINYKIFSFLYFTSTFYKLSNNQFEIATTVTILSSIYLVYICIALIRSALKHTGNKFFSYIVVGISLYTLLKLFINFYNELTYTLNEDQRIKAHIEIMNERTPYKISDSLILTNTSMDDKTITYDYKLTNMEEKKFYGINKYLFQDDLLLNNCENPQMSELLRKDYIFTYSYKNKHDYKVLDFEIKQASCDEFFKYERVLKEVLSSQIW